MAPAPCSAFSVREECARNVFVLRPRFFWDKWIIFDGDYTYDYDYNRFQFGYQAGLKLIAGNCLSLSAAWTGDLTSFCKYYDNNSRNDIKEKFQGVKFTIGYEF